MAEAVISFAVETIGNLLIEEAKSLHGLSDQVEQLQLELNQMRSFLRDADAKQQDEEAVKEWISQARDLAYAVEDLLERYAFKVASRRGKGIKSMVKKCVCVLNECYARHITGADIQMLKAKISDLTKRFQDYGIRSVMEREGGSCSLDQQLRRTYSHVIEDHFVGLGSDVELLVEKLVMENEIHHFRFVSISGMGGLGKSTLARKVYNHARVKSNFDGFAWIYISQTWQKEDILQQILISLIPNRTKEILTWKNAKLVRELFQIQQNKKNLVVLDDIWSINAWESIKQVFPMRNDGGKVLITTRNKDVALHIDPNGFHHQPRLLSVKESWELLQIKALRERRGQDQKETKKFETLGKEMVKACGGLPLALIVLGGTLATKKSLNEWEIVNKNIKVHIERGKSQNQGNVSKILALSYNDLPPKLKPCFLYLSKFDEDSDIEAETLYQLWIAEGMISLKDRVGQESMMDVAEGYLEELVQRCMVEGKAPKTPSILRSFESCRLHDLMRDLSLLKAKEENLLLSISYNDGFDDEIANDSPSTHLQVHRLAIRLSPRSLSKYVPLEKIKTRHLRSLALMISDAYEGRMARTMTSQFNQFKMLRVLAIEGLIHSADYSDLSCIDICNVLVDHRKVTKAVGKLIHLRYLSLKGSCFSCLPSSIGNLQHLQTLDLRDSEILRIPNVLWKMKQLRYLYLPDDYFGWEVSTKLKIFWKLRLNGLNRLEILENFCAPCCRVEDISRLKSLRALSVDADNQNLEHSRGVVDQIFTHNTLQKLKVRFLIGNLPKYKAHFCPRLIDLSLHCSGIREDPMETLEKFPNLRSLYLSYCYEGKEMRCTGSGFRQLKFLSLEGLFELETLWVDEGAMPNLSSLTIDECKKLECVPIGLKSITTLQKLEIVDMPNEFIDRIRLENNEEGPDFYKVSHIPSLIIRKI